MRFSSLTSPFKFGSDQFISLQFNSAYLLLRPWLLRTNDSACFAGEVQDELDIDFSFKQFGPRAEDVTP